MKIFLIFITSVLLSFNSFANTKISFALDWKFEGPSAPYFYAIDKGHFGEENLEVEISAGKGSLDAIPKVATGAFPIGFADINSLIKFLDQNPGAPVIVIFSSRSPILISLSFDFFVDTRWKFASLLIACLIDSSIVPDLSPP